MTNWRSVIYWPAYLALVVLRAILVGLMLVSSAAVEGIDRRAIWMNEWEKGNG